MMSGSLENLLPLLSEREHTVRASSLGNSLHGMLNEANEEEDSIIRILRDLGVLMEKARR